MQNSKDNHKTDKHNKQYNSESLQQWEHACEQLINCISRCCTSWKAEAKPKNWKDCSEEQKAQYYSKNLEKGCKAYWEAIKKQPYETAQKWAKEYQPLCNKLENAYKGCCADPKTCKCLESSKQTWNAITKCNSEINEYCKKPSANNVATYSNYSSNNKDPRSYSSKDGKNKSERPSYAPTGENSKESKKANNWKK